MLKPGPGSRHLYAGRHLGSKQVSPRLIPRAMIYLGFAAALIINDAYSGSLSLAFLVHT